MEYNRSTMRRANRPAEIPVKHHDPKDSKVVVYEVFRRSKRTVYHVRGGQANSVSKIMLDGFEGLPSGLFLYKRGFGFGRKGTFLLSAIKEHIGGGKPVELHIAKNNMKFPRKVKIGSAKFDEYQGGEIASILRREKVAQRLNEEDLQGLKDFFPKIFSTPLKGKGAGVRKQRDALIQNTKNLTDRIFLDDVVWEFEAKLKRRTSEEHWQKFLRDKAFRFLASYVTSIEKQNVSIAVSYPDFVLIDVYGFIDVFEIKRHDTGLLAFDASHENYYWKPELAQAISQIENYIDAVIKNADEYTKVVRRRKHVDIKVIRPRRYIVAGSSSQFSTEKEAEDFRKLGSSLKNTTFVLYDELLERLKNLRAKL